MGEQRIGQKLPNGRRENLSSNITYRGRSTLSADLQRKIGRQNVAFQHPEADSP
jgi:hypothetical protein